MLLTPLESCFAHNNNYSSSNNNNNNNVNIIIVRFIHIFSVSVMNPTTSLQSPSRTVGAGKQCSLKTKYETFLIFLRMEFHSIRRNIRKYCSIG